MEEKIFVREKIALTPFEPGDTLNLTRYLNDPVIYNNTLRIPFPYTEADAVSWIQHAQEIRAEHGRNFNWTIRHAEHGVIGGIGSFLRTGVDGHLDEIGYWLAEPFRGQGIMTDAVKALCASLFETRPALVRIEAKVHAYNPPSARVLERAGFEREGLARKHTIKNGTLIDVILFALVKE